MRIFQKIGILGRPRAKGIRQTLALLLQFLSHHTAKVFVDSDLKDLLKNKKINFLNKERLVKTCDLFIVIGGDGSLLQAAKMASEHHIPVVGINKGSLGFLTDILPSEIEKSLKSLLSGNYNEEERFLIEAKTKDEKNKNQRRLALNDIVLLPGNVAHMIEFEIYIDKQFVCKQRADGLIIATPTGSTAYALSGGGPILHPQLEALVLVPMFPHTLSSRPLVIESNSTIEIIISKNNEVSPWLSCDGDEKQSLFPGSSILIHKSKYSLRLIHPKDYNYFETLRSKLHWSGHLG